MLQELRSNGIEPNSVLLPLALLLETARGTQSEWLSYTNGLPSEALTLHRATPGDIELLSGTLIHKSLHSVLIRLHKLALILARHTPRLRNDSYVSAEAMQSTFSDALWAGETLCCAGVNVSSLPHASHEQVVLCSVDGEVAQIHGRLRRVLGAFFGPFQS